MQRYFLEQAIVNQKVAITGDDAHHIKNVMRGKLGDTVIGVTARREVFELEIISLEKNSVMLQVKHEVKIADENTLDNRAKAELEVTIYLGLLKADKMELVIQKACELGVHKLVPVAMQRSIVKLNDDKHNKKQARWQKIAKEAAEQAHRDYIMQVTEVIAWQELQNISGYDLVLLAYEGCRQQSLYNTLAKHPSAKKVAVIVGPEGGITEQELQLSTTSGHQIVTLGENILRAETAAIALAAGLLFYYQ